MFMDNRVVELDPHQTNVVFNSLNEQRNRLREEGKTTDGVDDVILKIAEAPTKRKRGCREAR